MAGQEKELDDNLFDDDSSESDLHDIIGAAYDKAMEGDDESGAGLDQPIDDDDLGTDDSMPSDKAYEAASDARVAQDAGRDKKDTAKADDDDDKAAPADDQKAQRADDADKDAGDKAQAGDDNAEDKAEDVAAAKLDDLVDGLPDDRKAEVARRIRDAESLAAPLAQSGFIRDQMQQFNATPQQAIGRMVELAEFATQKPDEYLAWAASEMAGGPDKAAELVEKAVGHLGLKLVKEDEAGGDDDLFEDPEKAELKRQLAELQKQTQKGPGFGPDTPERQAARQNAQALQNFVTETDATGNPVRPLINEPKVQERMAQMAAYYRQQNQPVTIDTIKQFYDRAAQEHMALTASLSASEQGQQPGPQQQNGSAAQGGDSVHDQIMNKKAESARKARRASKTIDGSGQGASRRSGPPPNASIEETIAYYASQDE